MIKNIKLMLLSFCLSVVPLTGEELERWAVEPQSNYHENLIGSFIESFNLESPSGEPTSLYKSADLLTVLTVFDVDCPLSLKLAPRLLSLEKAFPNVKFKHISISKLVTPQKVQEEFLRRQFEGQLLFDEGGRFLNGLQVKTTCEVFVIDRQGTLRYRGAIDDQYGINVTKEQPRNHYLKDALTALMASQDVKFKLTGAPGCLLDSQSQKVTQTEVTYHRQVARILQDKCQQCHRKGGVGPFELMTFEQVKERRKMIKYVLKKDIMPPWFADEGGPWLHNYDLTADEKGLLMKWLDSGTPEGNKNEAPVKKIWSSDYLLPDADLVVKLPKVQVQAEGLMPYKNVLIKIPLQKDKWVSAIEVRTKNPQVLHHALFFLSEGKRSRQAAIRGFFAGYVSGNSLNSYPEGTGKYLPAGKYLHGQLHYTPNGTAVTDEIEVAFKFMDKAPEFELTTASAFNTRLNIPPNEANYISKAQYRFPSEGYLLGFNPHMHLRGKSFKYELHKKDGSVQTLINIPRYDYNWQINYQLENPVPVKPGDTLKVTAVFDNSDNNKANPNPNVRVRFGEQTNDEMMIGYFEWYRSNVGKNQQMSSEIPTDLRNFANKVIVQIKAKQLSPQKGHKTIMAYAKKAVAAGKYSGSDARKYLALIVSDFKKNNPDLIQ